MALQKAQIDRLIEESQRGNSKAFGEIYDSFFDQIYKYLYYKVSAEYVDDLVATVFVKAWSKIQHYRKTAHPFSAWLFRIASNTVIDHYRTNKEFYELEERIADDHESFQPEAFAEKSLNRDRVHRALRKIRPKYREIVILRFMNDLSNKEVAEVMETTESNVRTLQFRALKKLRTALEDQESPAHQKQLQEEKTAKSLGFFGRLWSRPSGGTD